MENEAQQLFVSDPVFNKEGVSGYTSYTLQGSKIPEPLSRRYRDFDALRKKLVERWPEYLSQIFLIKKQWEIQIKKLLV